MQECVCGALLGPCSQPLWREVRGALLAEHTAPPQALREAARLGPWGRRSLLPAATLSPQGHHLRLPGSTAPSAWSLHPLAGQGSPGVSGSLGCWGGRSPPRGGGGRDQVAGQAGEGTEQETQLHLLTSLPAGSYQRPIQAMGDPCRPPTASPNSSSSGSVPAASG